MFQPDFAVTETDQVDDVSTDEKARDRWFLEQKGNKRVPKRLNVPNEALVSSGGPLRITGNITLIDEDGGVTHANHLTLCRCGASRSKPMCDDQHLDIEFLDTGNILNVSDCLPVIRDVRLSSHARQRRVFECLMAQDVLDGCDPKTLHNPCMMTLDAPDHIRLIITKEDVDRLEVDDPTKLGYITQTTLSVEDCQEVIDALRNQDH